jgi:glycosyltransferase involved in cell wall biosynthesis
MDIGEMEGIDNIPKISVIIPVRNGADKIEQCLKAVFSQFYRPYEVIVVDGHSSDKTVEKASQFPVQILYENYRTRAGACQIGVENASGEYVAFTDADCIPKTDWLENLVKELDEGIVGVGGGIMQTGEGFWTKSINLAFNTFLGSANSVQGRFFKDKRFLQSISGCNSMYRRKDVMRTGGFNVRLKGAEDAELNRRLSKLGKLLYTPNAIVLHNHGRGLKDFASQIYRQYGRYTTQSNIWRLQVFVPLLLIPLLLVSLIFIPWLFLSLLGLYLLLIGAYGLKFAIQQRNFKYLFSIPVVYITEHIFYSFAFWMGLFQRIKLLRTKRRAVLP